MPHISFKLKNNKPKSFKKVSTDGDITVPFDINVNSTYYLVYIEEENSIKPLQLYKTNDLAETEAKKIYLNKTEEKLILKNENGTLIEYDNVWNIQDVCIVGLKCKQDKISIKEHV